MEEFKTPENYWIVKHGLTHNHTSLIVYDFEGNVLIPGSVAYDRGEATIWFPTPVCGTVVMDDSRAQMLWNEICKIEAKNNDVQTFS